MDEWCIATCHSPAPFCLLESFSIIAQNDSLDPYHWNWEGFSSELRDAISNNILSSALKTLSLTGNTVPITFFLRTLHLQTLELHYVNLCLANRFWGRELKLAYTGGFEGSGTSPSGWPVCVAFAILRRAIYARSTRYLSSAYFSLIQDKKVSLTRNSFHSCAVYASYCPRFSIPEFLLWYLVFLDGFALHQPHFSCYTRTPGI